MKIGRMTLTIKLDGNWGSFQLAKSAPPLSVTDSAIAPSARMLLKMTTQRPALLAYFHGRFPAHGATQLRRPRNALTKGLARI